MIPILSGACAAASMLRDFRNTDAMLVFERDCLGVDIGVDDNVDDNIVTLFWEAAFAIRMVAGMDTEEHERIIVILFCLLSID